MIEFYKNIQTSIELLNALSDKPLTVSHLSTVLNIKPHNLQKIVRPLSKAGVLITTKGRGGGLKRSDGDISLYDIMSAFYDIPELESDKKHEAINQEYIKALKGIKVFDEWKLLEDWAFDVYEKKGKL